MSPPPLSSHMYKLTFRNGTSLSSDWTTDDTDPVPYFCILFQVGSIIYNELFLCKHRIKRIRGMRS